MIVDQLEKEPTANVSTASALTASATIANARARSNADLNKRIKTMENSFNSEY